jgi:nucleotide-binding universal stress UspA family protein
LWWRKDTLPRPDDPFRVGAKDIADELGIDIAIVRPRGSESRHALVEYTSRHAVDLILGELPPVGQRTRSSADLIWIQEHAESDVMYLGNHELEDVTSITVLGAGSPYDVAKIDAATRLARFESAGINLMHVLGEDATEAERNVITEYHEQLIDLSPAEMRSVVDQSTDLIRTIRTRARDTDLIIMGASRSGLGTELSERISESVDAPVLIVHTPDRGDTPLADRILRKLIY